MTAQSYLIDCCNIFLEQNVDTPSTGKVNFYDMDWWNIMNKLILCKIYDCYDGTTFYIDNTLKCIWPSIWDDIMVVSWLSV